MNALPHPFDDRDGWLWLNGEFLPWRDARIHILSHGLHYGSSVFEGIRSYDYKPFKLQEHTQRLFASAAILDLSIPFSEEVLNQATLECIQRNNVENGYIRPFVWRGSEMMAVSAQHTKIHVAIAAWSTKTYYDATLLEEGIRLNVAPWRRPSPECAPVHSKAAGLYMICTLSKHAAERAGYHDALMLDWRGQVAEATAANIFLVQQGQLHTPTPDCFLDGITRQTIIQLAKEMGYQVVERAIFPEEFAKTQEVFITGTAAEVTPVQEIGDYRFTPGSVTKTLRAAYQQLVRSA
jgi:branched-chain amino acid aminotransferase